MPVLLPPPVISVPAPTTSVPGRASNVIMFEPGEVVCDGTKIVDAHIVQPFSVTAVVFGGAPETALPSTYRFAFAIDTSGRPHTIRKEGGTAYYGYYLNTSDLAPSLAVSRFPAGAARRNCSIAYTMTSNPVASAPLPTLYELASRPEQGAVLEEISDRVRPAGADCSRGPGPYRRLNQPAFEKIKQPAGTWSWTFLGYDVDKAGKPTNIRVLGSAGNELLDRSGIKALAENRYAPGLGYHGCTYHFYRVGLSPGLAPELPAENACR
jgi:hypothetical protein